MKKFLKTTTLLMVLTMLLNLVACSSLGKVQKALEDKGYAIVENEENAASKEAKDDERVTNFYVFTNKDSLSLANALKLTVVVVTEFKATDDLIDYYKDSETMQGIVADIKEDGTAEQLYNYLKEAGLACGNCLITPIGFDAENVLNAIKELNK